MRNIVRRPFAIIAAVLALASSVSSAQEAPRATTDVAHEVRTRLMSLPDYGVFDLLTLGVENASVVSLGGYVVTETLKKDAERTAREVAGVTEVRNRIEIAPLSLVDEDIRRREYHAIYDESALSRYVTATNGPAIRPGLRAWGAQARMFPGGFDGPLLFESPFHAYEPIGIYAIHILVKNGVVTLAGVVDDDADKELAGITARGVTGVAGVATRTLIARNSTGSSSWKVSGSRPADHNGVSGPR
jgi:hypothetical protein